MRFVLRQRNDSEYVRNRAHLFDEAAILLPPTRHAISRMKQTPSAIDNPIIDLASRTPARRSGQRDDRVRAASPVRAAPRREAPASVQTPATTSADAKDPLWMKLGAIRVLRLCALVLWWGWEVRDQHYISAKFGVGYALGIIGTTLMALLLLYPARKRARAIRNLGPIRYWFRVHMVFGVIGPILVAVSLQFQSRLVQQSRRFCSARWSCRCPDSSDAISMRASTMACTDSKASLDELQRDFVQSATRVRSSRSCCRRSWTTSRESSDRCCHRTATLEPGIGAAMLAGVTTRWAYLRIRMKFAHALDEAALTSPIVARERDRLEANCSRYVAGRLQKLRKYAQFVLFERLFSIWHVVHYPLFVVLVVAVIVHIVAVHMY